MAASIPRFPTEILENVAALVVAEYLDEVLLGPLALPRMELVDKNHIELRHVTLDVISQAFDIALDTTGLGRLETKPWTKIMALRRVLSTCTGRRAMTSVKAYAEKMEHDGSAVLFLYWMIASIETAALPPDLLRSDLIAACRHHPVASDLVRDLLKIVPVYDLWRTYCLSAYHACLPAFQVTARARFVRTLVGVTVVTVYSTHQYALEGMLVVNNNVGLTLLEDNSHGLEALEDHLHDIENEDQDAVRCWGPDLDRAIGERRFKAWRTTLQYVVRMREDDSRFDNIRGIAKNLLASFQMRLAGLLSLGIQPAPFDLNLFTFIA